MRRLKAKFTLDQHEKLGLQIKPFKDFLCSVSCELANRYGKTSRQAKLAHQAFNKMTELKSALEDCAFRDHPNGASTDLYYWPSDVSSSPQWLSEEGAQ
jgi:hypothetical protein